MHLNRSREYFVRRSLCFWIYRFEEFDGERIFLITRDSGKCKSFIRKIDFFILYIYIYIYLFDEGYIYCWDSKHKRQLLVKRVAWDKTFDGRTKRKTVVLVQTTTIHVPLKSIVIYKLSERCAHWWHKNDEKVWAYLINKNNPIELGTIEFIDSTLFKRNCLVIVIHIPWLVLY
jgi:hypothetical protein